VLRRVLIVSRRSFLRGGRVGSTWRCGYRGGRCPHIPPTRSTTLLLCESIIFGFLSHKRTNPKLIGMHFREAFEIDVLGLMVERKREGDISLPCWGLSFYAWVIFFEPSSSFFRGHRWLFILFSY